MPKTIRNLNGEDAIELRGSEHDFAAKNVVSITPNDNVDLDVPVRGLYVGATGNVSLVPAGSDAAVTFVGVQVGTVLPVQTRRVRSTGTTSTSIMGLV